MMTVKQWKKVGWSQCGKKYKYSTCAGSVSSLGSRSRDNIYNLSGNPTCAFREVHYVTQPLVTEYVGLYLILPFHRWRLSAWNTAALTLGKLDILLASSHQLLGGAVHPALKRQDRLGKGPFAGFGTVVEDITESGYTKNQPILLGAFWENAFFVFLHYKINGSKGVFWP